MKPIHWILCLIMNAGFSAERTQAASEPESFHRFSMRHFGRMEDGTAIHQISLETDTAWKSGPSATEPR